MTGQRGPGAIQAAGPAASLLHSHHLSDTRPTEATQGVVCAHLLRPRPARDAPPSRQAGTASVEVHAAEPVRPGGCVVRCRAWPCIDIGFGHRPATRPAEVKSI